LFTANIPFVAGNHLLCQEFLTCCTEQSVGFVADLAYIKISSVRNILNTKND